MKVIERGDMAATLRAVAKRHPVVALIGARGTGKTRLAWDVFPDLPYLTLRDPEVWDMAEGKDPDALLARLPQGGIIDGMERGLAFFFHLCTYAKDRLPSPRFILIGGRQLSAGVDLIRLTSRHVVNVEIPLPGYGEIRNLLPPGISIDDVLLTGAYPSVVTHALPRHECFIQFLNDFLERDLRDILPVKELHRFHRFVKLCAARTGLALNLSSLAIECDISHVTAGQWLSVLEDCRLVFKLPPHPKGFGKRVVKTPKLYFADTGFAAWLMGIHDAAVLDIHPLRPALFETWVVGEFRKARLARGRKHDFFFWADNLGDRISLLYPRDGRLQPVEIRCGTTPNEEWFLSTRRWLALAGESAHPPIYIHAGTAENRDTKPGAGAIYSWRRIDEAGAFS